MCTHTLLDKNQVNKGKQTNILELFAHTKKMQYLCIRNQR